ncbi:MAG: GNAT family N-acetyltransferase [Chloroflexota bacterium]|nr:GNAT family N-acetyltransferase [Chloroflexota bacterium]
MNRVIRPVKRSDLDAINKIYNREIREGTATWHTEEWSAAERLDWFLSHVESNTQPIFVCVQQDAMEEKILGFSYLTNYRGSRGGFKYTRESTVYVDPEYQRMGIGTQLLIHSIEEARRLRLHVLIAWIDSTNSGSILLHESLNFEQIGVERETGYKFGEWRSNTEMSLLLDSETHDKS